ncbi:uncharacterized protein CEXT_233391 [Caerostris extrusa]|uniref:Uncharacterized protein n=1 Tax=Caerostris extrusa TaxID=172846 RepID=A0AAV4WZM8_CAEEX|nr:uncharacterized protein CEXT_233391 [Caerostris extrusa]
MALKSDMKKYLHLIVSGEWERIPESEFQSMHEFESSPEQRFIQSQRDKKSSPADDTNFNLHLLNIKYGETNEKIAKRAENFEEK